MTEPTKEAIPDDGLERALKWPDPTPEMLDDPRFNAIWTAIKIWDINVPEAYSGYCGATGNHVQAILDALIPVLDAFAAQRVAEAMPYPQKPEKYKYADLERVVATASAFLRATVKGSTNWPYKEMEALDDALLALKEPRR